MTKEEFEVYIKFKLIDVNLEGWSYIGIDSVDTFEEYQEKGGGYFYHLFKSKPNLNTGGNFWCTSVKGEGIQELHIKGISAVPNISHILIKL